MTETSVVPLRTGARPAGIIPTSLEEVFRLATAVVKSGLAPQGMDKPEAVMIAIMHGLEVGLPPMQAIQRVAVVNGRPTLWGDALPALLLARGFKLREWIEGEGDQRKAFCEVTRPNNEKTVRSFSVEDAKRAKLWQTQAVVRRKNQKGEWYDKDNDSPWWRYPERMLQMRARGFACRDGAADAMGGMYLAEEIEADPIDITPKDEKARKSSAEAKRDGTKEAWDGLMKAIEDAPEASDLMRLRTDQADLWKSLPPRWATLANESYFYRMKDWGIEVHPDTGEIVEQEQQAAE